MNEHVFVRCIKQDKAPLAKIDGTVLSEFKLLSERQVCMHCKKNKNK